MDDALQVTLLGHSCVRLRVGGSTVVIDPGAFSDASALDDADAVLITHEHVDHFVADRIHQALAAAPQLQVWTVGAVAEKLDAGGPRVHVIGDGDAFDVGPISVQVHGELHEVIHRDLPRVPNSGFLLRAGGEVLFAPGDAFTIPDDEVDVLFLPVHAPWSRTADIVDYVRAVSPGRSVAVHDAGLSAAGLASASTILDSLSNGIAYVRGAPGDNVTFSR